MTLWRTLQRAAVSFSSRTIPRLKPRLQAKACATLVLLSVTAAAQPTVLQHMMLFESTGTELNARETLIIQGQGTAKIPIYVPPAAGTPGIRNGTIAKTRTLGVFDLTVTNTEQEERVDVAWSMPFIVPETLSGRVLHGGGPVRLLFPKGVNVKGTMLESNGVEPTTLASIFTLKGNTYSIEIDGAGTLQTQQQPAETPEEGQSLDVILPRVYDRKYWILGLTIAILAIGFFLNYRASVKG